MNRTQQDEADRLLSVPRYHGIHIDEPEGVYYPPTPIKDAVSAAYGVPWQRGILIINGEVQYQGRVAGRDLYNLQDPVPYENVNQVNV